MTDRIVATYELPGPAAEAARAALSIAFEETVEVPFDFPLSRSIRSNVVGKTSRPVPIGKGRFQVKISFPAMLGTRIGALQNLVFGNASIWPGVRLVNLELPHTILRSLPGPNYGVDGIRRLTGAKKRPLLATALKPMGSSNEELSRTAAAFARGGGDIVKDDQNIVDHDFRSFCARVKKISVAVEKTKTKCLYFPHLSGPQEELISRLDYVLSCGLKGVLVCPSILALDQIRSFSASRKAVYMAHPAYSGAFYAERSHGIEHSLYMGTMMRLIGCDITVFPNAGGRFAFTPAECRAISERSAAPLGRLKPAFPAPGGGMSLQNAPAMARDFGADSVWLVGGRLLMHPGGAEAGARAFRAAISASFPD